MQVMRILVTGATGFVGRALSLRLQQEGHEVIALTRNPAKAMSTLGADIRAITIDDLVVNQGEGLGGIDAVVNLAGEPVVGKRWSSAQRKRLADSRIKLTRTLVDAMAALPSPPAILISASAVGFYGNRVDEPTEVGAQAGSGFLADLCVAWEQEALKAEKLSTRVVTLRTGIVLGIGGGALQKLLLPFRLGVGGRISDGTQPMPWVHLDDVVEIIMTVLGDKAISGAVNVVSPAPVSNREFTKLLAKAVRRPAIIPVPAMLLSIAMGDAASVLLGGQNILPTRLLKAGFKFRFPTLQTALSDLIGNDMGCTIRSVTEVPDSPYLRKRPPTYELRQVTVINEPLAEVHEFFSKAENLGLLTPSDVEFRITSPPIEVMKAGVTISYRIKVGALPVNWRTEIESFDASGFVDAQLRGPYRSWWHQHSFRAIGDKTVMEDRVLYALPFGWIGRLVHRFKVSKMLIHIFSYRTRAINLRFGCTPALGAPEALPSHDATSGKLANER